MLDNLSEFCRKAATEGFHPVEVVLPRHEWEECIGWFPDEGVQAKEAGWFEFNGIKFRHNA